MHHLWNISPHSLPEREMEAVARIHETARNYIYLTIYHFVVIIHTAAAWAVLFPQRWQQPKNSKTPEDDGGVQ